MLQGNKIVVVMPAYNAARTLRQTYEEVIAHDIVDEIILVDDASRDETAAIARTLDRVRVEVHPQNRGYGGNQKTCYRLALAAGADVDNYASSRLSIHADANSSDGNDDHQRTLSLRAGFQDSRRWSAAWRHALVEIRF